MNFTEKNMIELVQNICEEHSEIAKQSNNTSIGYLWYMYTRGSKAGIFKPFIFLAEINLLVATQMLFEDERERLIEMMKSNDKDNLYLVGLTILQLRGERLKKYGTYIIDNLAYKEINYTSDVLGPETFLIKM